MKKSVCSAVPDTASSGAGWRGGIWSSSHDTSRPDSHPLPSFAPPSLLDWSIRLRGTCKLKPRYLRPISLLRVYPGGHNSHPEAFGEEGRAPGSGAGCAARACVRMMCSESLLSCSSSGRSRRMNTRSNRDRSAALICACRVKVVGCWVKCERGHAVRGVLSAVVRDGASSRSSFSRKQQSIGNRHD